MTLIPIDRVYVLTAGGAIVRSSVYSDVVSVFGTGFVCVSSRFANPHSTMCFKSGIKLFPFSVGVYAILKRWLLYGSLTTSPAPSSLCNLSVRIFVDIFSGESRNSSKRDFLKNSMSRITTSVHLSPIKSRVQEIGQFDLLNITHPTIKSTTVETTDAFFKTPR